MTFSEEFSGILKDAMKLGLILGIAGMIKDVIEGPRYVPIYDVDAFRSMVRDEVRRVLEDQGYHGGSGNLFAKPVPMELQNIPSERPAKGSGGPTGD